MIRAHRAVVLLSGGLDSSTLAYLVKAHQAEELYLLTILYGQRHARERESAEAIAKSLNAHWEVVDISGVSRLLKSALTSQDIQVPDGHYAEESMKVTVVPNRNAIFLSIAFGYAASLGASLVGTAVHAGDHFIYPDCRPGFLEAFSRMENQSLPENTPSLYTPFEHYRKEEIVAVGHSLGVPFELTWSCYKGGEKHCGTCGTCVERREAFQRAGVLDPTEYEE